MPHSTMVEYPTSLTGSTLPTVNDGWTPGTGLSKVTHTEIRLSEHFRSDVVKESTRSWNPQRMINSKYDLSPTIKLLTRLAALWGTSEDERWPSAAWPDIQAFNDAKTFICYLPLTLIPMPDIGLADDGEINFFWKSGGNYVDLGFYGTSSYSYFAKSSKGDKIYGEDIPVSKGFPPKLAKLLMV